MMYYTNYKLYRIKSCLYCTNIIYTFLHHNRIILNYDMNDKYTITNIIIGTELNKYISYETPESIEAYKLNHLSIISSIHKCRNNFNKLQIE